MFVRLNCPRCGENKPCKGLCEECHIEDIMFCNGCHRYNHQFMLKAKYGKLLASILFLFCIANYGGIFF